MAARLFLFSGTDLYAIQAAVKQIRERFIAKYDDISVYRFAVDQLSGDQLTKQLSEVIQLEGLFADTRLLILSGIELLNQAKFKSLKSLLVQIPDHESVVCIVVAPGDGSVYEALRAEKGLQAILSEKVCNLPSTPVAVVSWASAQIVPFGATLGEGAKQWLARYYKMAFSQARLLREEYDRAQLLVGLGAGLYQALQQAAVLESEIQAETLERLHGQLQGTIGAFEITSLLSQGNTERATELFIDACQASGDQSEYCEQLLPALRWQFTRQPGRWSGRSKSLILRNLALVELCQKNTELPLYELVLQFFASLEYAKRGKWWPIVHERQLWMLSLART